MLLTAGDHAQIRRLLAAAEAEVCTDPNDTSVLSRHYADLSHGIRVLFTRDEGHWFPNEDWQNCWHLSVSRKTGPDSPVEEAPREHREAMVAEFFGPGLRASICHEHRPGSGIHHYRVFYNKQGAVIVPKGEMYTRRGAKGYFEKRAEVKAEAHA